jgi:hypothetical protein
MTVFEVAEQAHANEDREQHPGAALPWSLCLREPARGKPVDHGR